jgi:hypothetical protein
VRVVATAHRLGKVAPLTTVVAPSGPAVTDDRVTDVLGPAGRREFRTRLVAEEPW